MGFGERSSAIDAAERWVAGLPIPDDEKRHGVNLIQRYMLAVHNTMVERPDASLSPEDR